MVDYTEKKLLHVTIKSDGAKEVREETHIYKDGEYFATRNHYYVVPYDADVPAAIATFINAKKGKQPTLPPQAE